MTESGAAFYEHAHVIMRQIGDARAAAAQQMSDSPVGSVALGIPQSASAVLALPLFMAARRQLPGVSLQLTEELTGNLIEQLRHGRLNLAILFDDGQLKEFARKQIVEEQMFFISCAKGAPPQENRITLKEALKSPLILPSLQHGVRQRVERVSIESGCVIENIVAEIDSLNILKSAILANIGSTILPLAPFHRELQQGLVEAREIYAPAISRTITICASRNVPLTKASSAVSKLIVDVVRELCNTGQWHGAQPIYHHNVHLVI
jgi:LysR family nitrogen assimilation transcriptional regulator